MRLQDGRPLDEPTRVAMERSFGADLRDVRVHSGQDAAEAAAALGARGFAYGRDVVLGRSYAPGTVAGRLLLAHELAHIVQQSAGSGTAPAAAAETDARAAAGRALAGAPAPVAVATVPQMALSPDEDDARSRREAERRRSEERQAARGAKGARSRETQFPEWVGTVSKAETPYDTTVVLNDLQRRRKQAKTSEAKARIDDEIRSVISGASQASHQALDRAERIAAGGLTKAGKEKLPKAQADVQRDLHLGKGHAFEDTFGGGGKQVAFFRHTRITDDQAKAMIGAIRSAQKRQDEAVAAARGARQTGETRKQYLARTKAAATKARAANPIPEGPRIVDQVRPSLTRRGPRQPVMVEQKANDLHLMSDSKQNAAVSRVAAQLRRGATHEPAASVQAVEFRQRPRTDGHQPSRERELATQLMAKADKVQSVRFGPHLIKRDAEGMAEAIEAAKTRATASAKAKAEGQRERRNRRRRELYAEKRATRERAAAEAGGPAAAPKRKNRPAAKSTKAEPGPSAPAAKKGTKPAVAPKPQAPARKGSTPAAPTTADKPAAPAASKEQTTTPRPAAKPTTSTSTATARQRTTAPTQPAKATPGSKTQSAPTTPPKPATTPVRQKTPSTQTTTPGAKGGGSTTTVPPKLSLTTSPAPAAPKTGTPTSTPAQKGPRAPLGQRVSKAAGQVDNALGVVDQFKEFKRLTTQEHMSPAEAASRLVLNQTVLGTFLTALESDQTIDEALATTVGSEVGAYASQGMGGPASAVIGVVNHTAHTLGAPEEVSSATQLVAEATPGSVTSQLMMGGARSWNSLFQFARTGNTKSLDRLAMDMKGGKLGTPLQGWASMAEGIADVAAGDDPEKVLERLAEAGKGSAADKVGSWLGDKMWDLHEWATGNSDADWQKQVEEINRRTEERRRQRHALAGGGQ